MSEESADVAVARSRTRDRYEITVDDQQAGFTAESAPSSQTNEVASTRGTGHHNDTGHPALAISRGE